MTKLPRREFLILPALAGVAGCSPLGGGGYGELDRRAKNVRRELFERDPAAKRIADRAAAYIIFPNILKGGLLFGLSHGRGTMFSKGNIISHYSVSGLSAGLQAGLENFSMVLFFMTSDALADFRQSAGFEFGADLEYVVQENAMSIGASSVTHQKPVYAMIFNQSGALAGASLEAAKYSAF